MSSAQQTAVSPSPEAASDDQLFQTPPDLVCPITLSLLVDPVCNAAGQVYERASIQRHLLQAAISGQPPTDPISNAPLASLDLVPVWPMRSRSTEYMERTMRACVQRAATPSCADPVRYLRRAAELLLSADAARAASPIVPQPLHTQAGTHSSTGDAPGAAAASAAYCTHTAPPMHQQQQQHSVGSVAAVAPPVPGTAACTTGAPAAAAAGVPGLSRDFAQYLLQASNQGALHETLALKYFGNELLRAGCPDAASTQFYRLLLAADDTAQQAEFLQLCLDCVVAAAGAAADGSGGDAGGSADVHTHTSTLSKAAAGGGGGTTSPAILAKLADFVQRQRCLSPRAIVRMLESTHHGAEMALQLCQVLLERAATAAAAAAATVAPSGDSTSEGALGLPGGLGAVLELLLELQALVQGQLACQQQQLAEQVQQLQAQQQLCWPASDEAAGAPGGPDEGEEVEAVQRQKAAGREAVVSTAAGQVHSRGGHHRRRAWRGGKDAGVLFGLLVRAAAVATLSAASLAGGNHPALRAARVGPLLLLLRTGW